MRNAQFFFLNLIFFLKRWSECFSPSNTGGSSLKLSESCATLNEFGLDDVNCLIDKKFICVKGT